MTILTGEGLSRYLREICDAVKDRLWVAVPFIGDPKAVTQLLGNRWIKDERLDVRVLTDTDNAAYLNAESIERFRTKGTIKHLRGLHAKIYIADDRAVLTSANLTRTAFARRFEVGTIIEAESIMPVIELYKTWWKRAQDVDHTWFRNHQIQRKKKDDRETKEGSSLPNQYRLPEAPEDPMPQIAADFRDYDHFLRQYRKFAEEYASVLRQWTNSPLFFETDSFLNYLFHDAPRCPSAAYRRKPVQVLSASDRRRLIKHHATEYEKWIANDANARWRERASELIQQLLKPERIDTISRDDAKDVVNQLNCMNSLPLNKTRFLNAKNNDLHNIRKAWKDLLHGSNDLLSRMTACHDLLRYFGDSSIQELLGFYFPEQYPLRNSNSNAGLRFFGYDVKAH